MEATSSSRQRRRLRRWRATSACKESHVQHREHRDETCVPGNGGRRTRRGAGVKGHDGLEAKRGRGQWQPTDRG